MTRTVFAFGADIDDLIKLHYITEDSLHEAMQSVEGLKLFSSGADLSTAGAQLAEMAPSDQVIGFINSLIYFAKKRSASDIHVEPRDGDSVVRFRIDGNLNDVLTVPARVH